MTTKLYRIDFPIWATAYVRADNAIEAGRIAIENYSDAGFTLQHEDVNDGSFDDLPDVSLSPVMTGALPEAWTEAPELADDADEE